MVVAFVLIVLAWGRIENRVSELVARQTSLMERMDERGERFTAMEANVAVLQDRISRLDRDMINVLRARDQPSPQR
jgi:hypothetical protein